MKSKSNRKGKPKTSKKPKDVFGRTLTELIVYTGNDKQTAFAGSFFEDQTLGEIITHKLLRNLEVIDGNGMKVDIHQPISKLKTNSVSIQDSDFTFS